MSSAFQGDAREVPHAALVTPNCWKVLGRDLRSVSTCHVIKWHIRGKSLALDVRVQSVLDGVHRRLTVCLCVLVRIWLETCKESGLEVRFFFW